MCKDLDACGEVGEVAFPAQAGDEPLESPPWTPNILTQAGLRGLSQLEARGVRPGETKEESS